MQYAYFKYETFWWLPLDKVKSRWYAQILEFRSYFFCTFILQNDKMQSCVSSLETQTMTLNWKLFSVKCIKSENCKIIIQTSGSKLTVPGVSLCGTIFGFEKCEAKCGSKIFVYFEGHKIWMQPNNKAYFRKQIFRNHMLWRNMRGWYGYFWRNPVIRYDYGTVGHFLFTLTTDWKSFSIS